MSDEKTRPHWLPAPHFYNLNQSCVLIRQAFPDNVGIYLVGSSLRSRDYRDVDVRLMLTDTAYDRLFHGADWTNAFWSLLCVAISLWLRQQSDLPIDFQIQRMSAANELHDGKRNALGVFLDYPGERPSDIRGDS